jgi:hypothetical protein
MTAVAPSRLGIGRAIVVGGLVVGTLDALDAILFFGLRGASPGRIFQGIASGLLGRAALDGGMATVLLGLGIHYLIAFSVVITYILAARRFDLLVRAWPWCGMAYGVGVWLFMNFVVIPLSAIHRGGFVAPVVVNGLLIHAFGVGLPSAWFARLARGPGWWAEPV